MNEQTSDCLSFPKEDVLPCSVHEQTGWVMCFLKNTRWFFFYQNFCTLALPLKLIKMKLNLHILNLNWNLRALITWIDMTAHHKTQQLCEQDVYQHAWWLLPAYGGEQQECSTGCLFIPSPLKRSASTAAAVTVVKCSGSGISVEGIRMMSLKVQSPLSVALGANDVVTCQKNKANTVFLEIIQEHTAED